MHIQKILLSLQHIFKKNKFMEYLKQGQLFTDAEMGMRDNAERKEVVNAISKFSNSLVKAFEDAMVDHNEDVRIHPIASKETSYRFNHLHGMILEQLTKLDCVTLGETYSGNNNRYLKIGGFLFWVKKVDKRFRPSINHTRHAGIMTAQQVEKGKNNDALLILGYELTKDEHSIKNLSVLYQLNGENIWAPISLFELAVTNNSKIAPVQSTANSETLVKIKKGISKKKNADDSRI